jgi:hypothetical protein
MDFQSCFFYLDYSMQTNNNNEPQENLNSEANSGQDMALMESSVVNSMIDTMPRSRENMRSRENYYNIQSSGTRMDPAQDFPFSPGDITGVGRPSPSINKPEGITSIIKRYAHRKHSVIGNTHHAERLVNPKVRAKKFGY